MTDSLKLKDFDFQLPQSLIAQKPLTIRDQSKLMVIDRKSGSIQERGQSGSHGRGPIPMEQEVIN